jgi:cell division protein FtsN
MVAVGTYPTRGEAELAQSVLAASGIESRVVSDDAGGAYPFPLEGGAHVLVEEADADAARKALSS